MKYETIVSMEIEAQSPFLKALQFIIETLEKLLFEPQRRRGTEKNQEISLLLLCVWASLRFNLMFFKVLNS